jgi:P27 family predicted phage terminase small subunit
MVGRPRKPTALKVLHGDFDKNPQRRNHREPVPGKQPPKCPAWITGEARKEWKRIVDELESMGVASGVDRAALEQYCIAYDAWRQALRTVRKEGRTFASNHGPRVHPADTLARSYADLCHRILCQFGLTPSSRTRLAIDHETHTHPDEEEYFPENRSAKA